MPIDFKQPVPTTLDEAIDRIVSGLTDLERMHIEKNGADVSHFSSGTAIRNNWGLWMGSDLKTNLETTYGIGHADDMCGLILHGVTAKVCGQPYDVMAFVAVYKDHWLRMNLDPLTLKALPKLNPVQDVPLDAVKD